MDPKRVKSLVFLGAAVAGLAASKIAEVRGQSLCLACTGIFGESCEPCQAGEDCATSCTDGSEGFEDCVISGQVCWP
jgi:hypothetical protein